jgi:hypothetical protein
MVLTRLVHARPSAQGYPVRDLPVLDNNDTDPIVRSLDNIDVLPLMMSNDLIVDENDGFTFVSTYELNRHFSYIEPVENQTLQTLHSADMGSKCIVGYMDNMSYEGPNTHLICRKHF